MDKFRLLKKLLPLALLSGLTSCQTNYDPAGMAQVSKNAAVQKEKENAWLHQQKLVQASREEISTASAGEVPFVGNKASIPKLSLSVVFTKGSLRSVKGVGTHNVFTTTSSYELRNVRTGKLLLKTASTIANGALDQDGYKQKVLVSQDGARVLIYEFWNCGDGPHSTCALATKISDRDVWEVEYLKLPEFDGFDGVPDRGPTPIGFSGCDLIFDALRSGTAYKKKITEIKKTGNPLPFMVG